MPMSAPAGRARLIVVESHPYLKDLIHRLLVPDPSLEIVAELESGVEAVGEARRLGADLILMDVHLPDTNGLAVVRMLKDLLPRCRTVLLINDPEIRQLALASGAVDTITKDRLSVDLSATLASIRGAPTSPTAGSEGHSNLHR